MPRRGRPSAYRPEFADQAGKLCRLFGAIDERLAKFFGVSERTLATWKQRHPEFAAAIAEGKELPDAEVASALYRRALGYSHPAVKIFTDSKLETSLEVPYTEHYPPDTVACIFWLKNRQPKLWREQQDIRHLPIPLASMTEAQLGRIAEGEDPMAVLSGTMVKTFVPEGGRDG